MVAWVLGAQPSQAHIRPFQPHRDMSALADLIEVAFGEDLELTGSRMVRDLRQMALAGPLLRIARPVDGYLNGLVWLEGRDLVGNVSVNPKGRGAWAITNVAVLPEYRGRGIAGQLVDAAIAHARAQGGKRILLQVRSDNAIAKAIYARRGWRRFDTWHELHLSVGRRSTLIGATDADLRRVRIGDGRELYRLAALSTPPDILRALPLAADDYRRDWRWMLARELQLAFAGVESLELVGPRTGPLAAYGRLRVSLSSDPYEVSLLVAPSARGGWEERLLEGLLVLSQSAPRHDLRSYVSDAHSEALEAFHTCGFRTLRVLDQMVLELV